MEGDGGSSGLAPLVAEGAKRVRLRRRRRRRVACLQTSYPSFPVLFDPSPSVYVLCSGHDADARPDRLERFAVYRRDVRDTLINACVCFCLASSLFASRRRLWFRLSSPIPCTSPFRSRALPYLLRHPSPLSSSPCRTSPPRYRIHFTLPPYSSLLPSPFLALAP
jgi:hypothetical protein